MRLPYHVKKIFFTEPNFDLPVVELQIKKKNLRGEGLWVGTFRWSLKSATLRQIMRFCMGTGKISIGKIPCPQLNLINSKRKTGVLKKFMSEEKGRKSGFYIPSVSMSK